MSYGSPAYIFFFLLLNALPESLVHAMFVFGILNLRFDVRWILAVAGLQTVTNLIMFLPINAFVHSIIMIFTLALYTFIITRARLSQALLAALICITITILAEIAYSGLLLQLTGLTVNAVRNNPFLISAFAVPYELLFLALALAKNHYNRRRGLLHEA